MFGERLRHLREHQELSQGEAAYRLGISQNTYSRYERDVREPDFKTLIKIAKFYNVSIDYLLGNEVAENIDMVDIYNFFSNGNYTIDGRFPNDSDRKMLYSVVHAIYENKEN